MDLMCVRLQLHLLSEYRLPGYLPDKTADSKVKTRQHKGTSVFALCKTIVAKISAHQVGIDVDYSGGTTSGPGAFSDFI